MAEATSPPATSPPPTSTSATDKATTSSAEQQPTSLPQTTTAPAAEEPVTESGEQQSVPATDTEPATGEPVIESTDQQPTFSTNADINTGKMARQPPQDTIRNPKFGPGVRQAFFSTELGTRAPRELSPLRMPPIARSSNGPEVVVAAAKYWMTKYKEQCLCIFRGQGWVVEDLWDAEDLHIEGKRFCEEMLKYISGATHWAAKEFANDWAKAHPNRLDFSGAPPMGNVYDINDPLAIVDQIFIFNEPVSFPRPFLWHVAFIVISTWCAMRSLNRIDFDVYLGQDIWDPPGGKAVETIPTAPVVDKKPKGSSASDTKGPAHEPVASLALPIQPNMRCGSQRVLSQAAMQTSGHHVPSMRGGDVGAMAGHSMLSPSTHPQAMNVPKGNRNMGSGSYNQPPGWVENRGVPGSYSRQASGASMHSPQFMPAAMAIPQPMAMVPGPPMVPYAQGPPMMPAHGYPHVQHYQSGPMQTPPMAPAYLHQPHGPHAMGDMTNNMHYSNNMGVQYADPRAPMPRRTSHHNAHNANVLYDPYNGTNPNFKKPSGYNAGGKKGGLSSFAVQPGQGRKMSGGRPPYNNSNTDHAVNMPANGGRYNDFSHQKRVQEDDLSITGDSVAGCGHTWIGAENMTVTELWIGDLPTDVHKDEIIQLFQQNAGVTPTAVSIRTHTNNSSCHAFATFNSLPDVKTALNIREHKPQLRNGTCKPSVTVPKRFFQKDASSTQRKESSSSSYFPNSQTGLSEDRNTRGVTRMSAHDEESAVVGTDAVLNAAGSGKALYSPQDVRSGLPKKSAQQSESTDTALTGSPKPDKSKKSPTKKAKAKGKRASPFEKANPTEEAAKVAGKLEAYGSAPAAVDTATIVDSKETVVASPNEGLQGLVSAPAVETSNAGTKNEEQAGSMVSPAHETIQAPTSDDTSISLHDPVKASEVAHNEVKSPPKDPSPPPIEDTVSDDEAKNDVSFHSAQEVQTPQPDGTTTPPLHLTETCSYFADTSMAPEVAVEPEVSHSQEPLTEPEASEAKATSQDVPADKSAPVQDAANASTSSNASVATPNEASRPEAAKKNDAQVQSLHPFAKKQVSQAKKDKAAKKKQQKNEKQEAERIAKAKAEQREREEGDKKAQATKFAVSGPPAATGEPATTNQATPGTKKSKGKTKAKASTANSVNCADQEKKGNGGDDTGKLTGGIDTVSKEIDSVTQKVDIVETSMVQPKNLASSVASSHASYPEAMSSIASPGPAVTQAPQGLSKKAPTQEVHSHQNHFSQNILTHAPGSQGTGFEIDPQQSHIPQSSGAPVHQPPQPDMSFSAFHFHGLPSSDTLVFGDDYARINVFTTVPPNTATSDPTQIDTADAGASQADSSQTGTPTKKKKNKPKKKKAASASADTETAPPVDNAPNLDLDDDDIDQDDPFASQLGYIADMKRAVKQGKEAAAKSEKDEKFKAINAYIKQAEEDNKKDIPPLVHR